MHCGAVRTTLQTRAPARADELGRCISHSNNLCPSSQAGTFMFLAIWDAAPQGPGVSHCLLCEWRHAEVSLCPLPPFTRPFLLQAAKLVEVDHSIVVPSLDEGSCDDDVPDQAPKLVKLGMCNNRG